MIEDGFSIFMPFSVGSLDSENVEFEEMSVVGKGGASQVI